VERVPDSRLVRFRVCYLKDFPEMVLLPHGIVKIEQVGWAVEGADDLDFARRNSESELESV
jgi:hypothetical protein